MITACRYARENSMPFLGLCLGMYIAVIEFSRNILRIEQSSSINAEDSIDMIAEHYGILKKGETMRLGAFPCCVIQNTTLAKVYGTGLINERHRHSYEINNEYRDILCEAGLVISGVSPDKTLVEAIELNSSPFFVGVQFHPEYKSRPNKPHPLFLSFVRESESFLLQN